MNDPGIFPDGNAVGSVDLKTESIDRDYRLNGPVLVESRRKKRNREAHDRARRGLEGGTPTKRQQTALDAVRHFERARRHCELPDGKQCLSGRSLLAIYRRGGKFRFYAYTRIERICARRRDQVRTLMTPRDWLALELVLAAQLLFDLQALFAGYDDLAEILGCHYDTVAHTMHKLEQLGLVRLVPMHDEDDYGNFERQANAYWVPERVLALLQIKRRPKVKPPIAPGSPYDAALDRMVKRDQPQSGVEENQPSDPANPDPTDTRVLIADTNESGEREREARSGGALAPLAGDFFRPTKSDESPTGPVAADRVKTRPAAPSGSEEESQSSDEKPRLKRHQNPASLSLFEQRIAAKLHRALQQARNHDAEVLREALADVARTKASLKAAFAAWCREIPGGRASSSSPSDEAVQIGRLVLSADDARLASLAAERARLASLARAAHENPDLDQSLRALEEREAELDQGAAAASAPTDENGGDS
jgi:hypothetical protein